MACRLVLQGEVADVPRSRGDEILPFLLAPILVAVVRCLVESGGHHGLGIGPCAAVEGPLRDQELESDLQEGTEIFANFS
ncbi:MAG: hypothetical protein MJE68_24255 [Proteobacteria bacterium]|nr:hypothetical protein [Pseudomonadota bacterium]